jgi:hypothetical protein
MRQIKASVYIICTLLLTSCSGSLKLIDSEKRIIVAGREGIENKERYTITIENRCKDDVTINEIIVYSNNGYYNMAFDITANGNTTLLKKLDKGEIYTIVAIPKYETKLTDKVCNKDFKILLKYSVGKRTQTMFIKSVKEGKVILRH